MLNTAGFNYIYLLWNKYISMSIHVHFYREQSTVTLIQRMQHSKNRLCVETSCTAAAAPLLERTATPDRNRVQCEHSDPLTWVRKKNPHCKRSMFESG